MNHLPTNHQVDSHLPTNCQIYKYLPLLMRIKPKAVELTLPKNWARKEKREYWAENSY